MSILVSRCVKRSQIVQELLASWQLNHPDALFAADIEQLCGESVETCQLLRSAWRTLYESLFTGPAFNVETVGRLFHQTVRRSIEVVAEVKNLVREAERRRFPIEKSAELAIQLEQLEAVERTIAASWPFVDRALVAEARSAFDRGEYQSVGELLHDAQGDCAGADQSSHR